VAWQSRIARDHPVVGRILAVRAGRFPSRDDMLAQLDPPRVVVLGEKHDNPDHLRLQGEILRQLAKRGEAPAVVFEMLDDAQEQAVTSFRAEHPRDVDGLGQAIDWVHSGWPAWSLYRPVFAAALDADLPILAGGIARDTVMQIARKGVGVLDPALVAAHALGTALEPAAQASLRDAMREAHCNMLPENLLDSMALVQRARDATLAQRTEQGVQRSGRAVLVTGNGHARSDRGASRQLADVYDLEPVVVAFVEVVDGQDTPEAYGESFASDALPFDFVWFTPRADDDDPCDALRNRK
jgi:uncharacterized iron-regulated protein